MTVMDQNTPKQEIPSLHEREINEQAPISLEEMLRKVKEMNEKVLQDLQQDPKIRVAKYREWFLRGLEGR